MARKRRDESSDLELELTPMIDVVFLLITFFLIVGTLVSEELSPLHLPSAEVPTTALAPQTLILNLDRQGVMYVHGQRLEDTVQLERLLDSARRSGTRRILLRADRDAIYDRVQHVMMACARADLLVLDLGVTTETR